MGLFRKNQKEEGSIPQLPELPDLPELPEPNKDKTQRLPIYIPNSFNQRNSFNEKFSQSAIKETVSGKEEGDEEAWEADEFAREQEMRMMQQPLKKPMTRQYEEDGEIKIPSEFKHIATQMKKTEPLFIRIDKFEESSGNFEKIKESVFEIDKLLREIKRTQEQEERELTLWEDKVQLIKKQIEKIDRELFSRIE